MDFDWSQDQDELRAHLRSIVEDVVPPGWSARDRDVATPDRLELTMRLCQRLAAEDLWIPHWPAAYGGRDASPWEQIIIGEELWGAGEPRGPQYMNTNWIAPAIVAAGTEEQKQRLLPPIAAGEVLWCQGFSEPEAGSDLASMRMTAVRDGDVYVLNGQKVWTSYAHVAQYCFLLARTNPEVPKRRGISILLVPMDLPGIEVREIPSVLGAHAIHEVFFDDVHVPAGCRLGEENEGWPLIRKVLANERIGAARFERASRVLASGIAATDAGGPQDRAAAGQALAACEAARMLAYAAVQDRIDGRDDTGSASTSRVASVAAERAAAQVLAAEHGQESEAAGNPADDQFTVSMPVSITAGTLEVQLDLVARLALRLPRG
ncbi:MAG TPA: acyl-CoA dehydrogenase family protein [Streptosporangiaceae bacterium]|nr:acyl-CoA dehydrogenase family protein [Streptosporangiaceae bacterium]